FESELTIAIRTPASELSLRGPIQLRHNTFRSPGLETDIRLTNLGELASIEDMNAESLALRGILAVENAAEADFHGTLDLEDLALPGLKINSISGPVQLARDGPALDFDIDLAGIQTQQMKSAVSELLGNAATARLSGSADFEDNTFTIENASINADGARLNISGDSNRLTGEFSVSLSSFGFDQDAKTNGSVSAVFHDNNEIATQLEAELLASDIYGWSGFTGTDDPLKLTADVNLESDGNITLKTFRASRPGFDLNANGEVSEKGIALTSTGQMREIANATLGLSIDDLKLNLEISGQPKDDVRLTLNVSTESLRLELSTIEDLNLGWAGSGPVTEWASRLNVSAASEFGDLVLALEPQIIDETWSTGEIVGSVSELQLSGYASGQIDNADQLETRLQIDGPLSGASPLSDISASVELNGNKIAAQGRVSHSPIASLDSGVLGFSVDRDVNHPVTSKVSWTTNYLGPDGRRPVSLDLSARSDLENRYHQINLDGQFDSLPIGTPTPIEFAQSDSGWSFEGALNLLDGQLNLSANNIGDSVSASASLRSVEIGNLTDSLLGQGLRGTLNGTTRFEYAPTSRAFELNLNLANLSDVEGEVDPANIVLTSQYADGVILSNFTADSTNLSLGGEGQTGIEWDSLVPKINAETPQTFAISGGGEIGAIATLLTPPDTSIAGTAELEIVADISNEARQIGGFVNVSNGSFEQGDLGILFTDIALQSRVDQDVVQIDQFMAQDGRGGSLSGNGELSLSDGGAGRLSLTSKNMQWVSRDDLSAELSGEILVRGSKDQIRVNAEMNVDEAYIDLDRLPAPSRPTLPVRFIDELESDSSPPALIDLNIGISSDSGIVAEGLGLDAALSVDMRVTGSIYDPIFLGEADVVRGNYVFATQRFDFVDSRVLLRPGSDPITLDIRAEREDSDVTAIVKISGTPERPVITISSQPDLPEDEILSRILFGQSPGQLSPVQAARLASTLASLAGGNGFDVLGELESALFVDRIDLTETAEGAAVLATGKYVADNVYVEVQNRIDGNAGVSVEWEPFDNIAVTGATETGGNQEISLRWKRDFNHIRNKRLGTETEAEIAE
ncbi:MAG: translocation/assembly module TamB domain-containing protein, partial [Pseudomonadota bacterium]